eukprot:3873621-Alexandrium_andersonii.AAC.1
MRRKPLETVRVCFGPNYAAFTIMLALSLLVARICQPVPRRAPHISGWQREPATEPADASAGNAATRLALTGRWPCRRGRSSPRRGRRCP